MFRRLRRPSSPDDTRGHGPWASPEAEEAFEAAAGRVDGAREALLAAVPRARGPGAPLAQAVASFEEDLRAAREALDRWPSAVAGDVRSACVNAVAESLRRAERLRLEAAPRGYEELYVLLAEALDPLDVFGEVARSLREGH